MELLKNGFLESEEAVLLFVGRAEAAAAAAAM